MGDCIYLGLHLSVLKTLLVPFDEGVFVCKIFTALSKTCCVCQSAACKLRSVFLAGGELLPGTLADGRHAGFLPCVCAHVHVSVCVCVRVCGCVCVCM